MGKPFVCLERRGLFVQLLGVGKSCVSVFFRYAAVPDVAYATLYDVIDGVVYAVLLYAELHAVLYATVHAIVLCTGMLCSAMWCMLGCILSML